MDNRYAMVLRAHFRRPTGLQDGLLPSLGLLFFASAFAMSVIVPRHARPDLFTAFTIGIGVALTGAGLWTKLREQLLSDRRHLWPDFVAPHVAVFAALSLVITCVVPLLLPNQAGMSAIGLMAFVATLFASTGCFFALPSPLIQVLGAACFACLMCAATGEWLWENLSGGQNVLAATLLFAAAAIACTAIVLRMLAITEDHPRYAQGPWPACEQAGLQARKRASVAGQYPRWWPTPRLRIDALVPSGTGLIARSRRRRAVVRLNWFLYAVLPGINLMMQRRMQPGNTSSIALPSTLLPAVIYLLFPAMVSVSWVQAWPCLELDSLRAVTRRELVREIGAAIAIQTLQAWAIVAAIFTIGAISLHAPTFLIASILLGSLAMQPLAFGVATWAMRYRSVGLQTLLCMPLIIPITLLGIWLESNSAESLVFTCLAACGVALLGFGLTWWASRLWLNTELG